MEITLTLLAGFFMLSLVFEVMKLVWRGFLQILKIGIVISALFSVVLATFFENAIDIWYVTGSFAASSLLVPMLCCFYKKEVRHPLALIVIPIAVTATWFLWGGPNVDPMYPGLLSSVVCYLLLRR